MIYDNGSMMRLFGVINNSNNELIGMLLLFNGK